MFLEAFQAAVRAGYRTLGAEPFEVGSDGARVRGYHLPARARRPGPPVVLLHGMGDASTTWYRVVRPLAARHPVTLVDLPGHGESSLPGDRTFWRPSEAAAAVARVIAKQHEGPAIVVGQSMGGWISMALAISRPEAVDRLVLVSPAGIMHPAAGRAVALLQPADVDAVLKLWTVLWHRMPATAPLIARDSLAKYSDGPIADFLRDTPIEEMMGPAQLRRIRAPTLVVWGTDDGLLPIETPSLLLRYVPEASVTWLRRCGHLPQLERPVALAQRILDFAGG